MGIGDGHYCLTGSAGLCLGSRAWELQLLEYRSGRKLKRERFSGLVSVEEIEMGNGEIKYVIFERDDFKGSRKTVLLNKKEGVQGLDLVWYC